MTDTAVDPVLSAAPPSFLIDGDRPAVLKISNTAEDPARLDLEALAAQRVAQLDPGLPVALPWLVPGTKEYRAIIRRAGQAHFASEAAADAADDEQHLQAPVRHGDLGDPEDRRLTAARCSATTTDPVAPGERPQLAPLTDGVSSGHLVEISGP